MTDLASIRYCTAYIIRHGQKFYTVKVRGQQWLIMPGQVEAAFGPDAQARFGYSDLGDCCGFTSRKAALQLAKELNSLGRTSKDLLAQYETKMRTPEVIRLINLADNQ